MSDPRRAEFTDIEDIILAHGVRGMDIVRKALPPGSCARAARLLLSRKGPVLIGTGFPVAGSFETDGPIGAIALYRALDVLGSEPIFVCAPPISRVLAAGYRTREIPILDWKATSPLAAALLAETRPVLVVSIERPGVAADGRYYNMRGEEITGALAKLDLLFELCACPRIAVGDGGNEIGMGKAASALAGFRVVPSVTSCDELIVATVSNWGAYGIIAAMSRLLGTDLLEGFDPIAVAAELIGRGAVDGTTGAPALTEDGFPMDYGLAVLRRLRAGTAER